MGFTYNNLDIYSAILLFLELRNLNRILVLSQIYSFYKEKDNVNISYFGPSNKYLNIHDSD